ncbi:hypothetical protein GCM10022223_18200 [Kineosporia mesophila]|uniref:RNA polymerase sigma-70 region 2 domain-containing protein n=2 Tax=Kineosporia mesophila TaxID=566012 RepID=A0ABP6ZCH2_9ACTN
MAPLRRYVGARVRVDDREDIVQETLTRMLKARARVEPGTEIAYALVVARHVIIDRAAQESRARDNRPRLIDLTAPPLPDDILLGVEERYAIREALEQLPDSQRAMFLAHVLNDEPLTSLANDSETTSGSIGSLMARTRARLRVDYVLALRGISELPSPRCRPVLLALSGADTRRQQALRAGHHLLTCPVCDSIAEPLMRRRSALAAFLPWLGLGPIVAWLRRSLRTGAGQATAAATGTALAGVVLVSVVHTLDSSPSASAAATAGAPVTAPVSSQPADGVAAITRLTDDRSLSAGNVPLASLAGTRVRGSSVTVLEVAANEGFWVKNPGGTKVWVQLSDFGTESAVKVRRDDTVNFVATVTAHGSDFADRVGVSAAEGAALLTAEHAHLTVRERDLHHS